MKRAFRSCCVLFLVATSVALSQSMPAGNSQEPTTGSGAPGMSSMNGDPTTEASLQKMETELSQAAAAQDPTPFEKYLDDKIVALGPGWKASSKSEVLQSIKQSPCTMSKPTLAGFSYKWISPDIVLVSYSSSQTNTCKGKTTPADEHDSSLWQRKNGKWMAVFHQGTADLPASTTGGN